MGRTLPPFSQLIEHERRAWASFKRALRKADQEVFDRLFDCAKLHVQAGVYLSRPWPFEVIAMAMLLEHHKLLERLLTRLEGVEVRLSGGAREWPSTGGGAVASLPGERSAAPAAGDEGEGDVESAEERPSGGGRLLIDDDQHGGQSILNW